MSDDRVTDCAVTVVAATVLDSPWLTTTPPLRVCRGYLNTRTGTEFIVIGRHHRDKAVSKIAIVPDGAQFKPMAVGDECIPSEFALDAYRAVLEAEKETK